MDVRDLMLEELGRMLDGEETLAQEVLPQLREQVSERNLRVSFDEHLAQTRLQVQRIEEVFALLKEKPRRGRNPVLAALRAEHEAVLERLSEPVLRDLHCASSAARTEHLEIASYHSLITLANILGEPDAVHLLEASLHEEEDALEKVEKAIPERLAGELAPA